MSNVYYFFSCFNNYDILIGEQHKFIKGIKDQVIILDDHSDEDEQAKGRKFCSENDLMFVVNRYKGLQMGIKFLTEEIVPNATWLISLQQDTFINLETSPTAYIDERLAKISAKKLPIGAVGFQNFVKNSHYNFEVHHSDAFNTLQTWLGVFFLSPSKHFVPQGLQYKVVALVAKSSLLAKLTKKFRHRVIVNRNFAPRTFPNFYEVSAKFEGLASIELPAWAAVAINLDVWRKKIVPDQNFVFHLWFPDVAMQFLSKNIYVCVDTTIHVVNDVNLKEKYGQLGSVEEGKIIKSTKMEKYGGHLDVFKKKWGFDYEYIYPNTSDVEKRFKGTLIGKYINQNPSNGPIKLFKI